MESGSPTDRGFLIGILCLGIIILAKRKFNWAEAVKENSWLMLLIIYTLVSILWSDIPFSSFKRWIRELVAVVMAFVVLTEAEPHRALQCLFRRTIYILIPFSLLLIKYYPHLGVLYGRWSGALQWIGVSLQKNGLARLCLFALFFLVWTLIRRWQGHDISVARYQTHVEVFLLFLTVWIFTGPQHVLTYSATSTAALAVGLMVLIGFLWMKKRNRVIGVNTLTIIFVLIIVYGTITPFIGKLTLFDVSSTLGRDETLTGRADIWAIVLPYAMQKPILGHGFSSFWTDSMRNMSSSNAHNGYLEVILSIGLFGLFFVSMFLLSCCRKAQREQANDYDWGSLSICLLLMATVHNIGESSIDSLSSHLTAIILFLAVSATANTSNTP